MSWQKNQSTMSWQLSLTSNSRVGQSLPSGVKRSHCNGIFFGSVAESPRTSPDTSPSQVAIFMPVRSGLESGENILLKINSLRQYPIIDDCDTWQTQGMESDTERHFCQENISLLTTIRRFLEDLLSQARQGSPRTGQLGY